MSRIRLLAFSMLLSFVLGTSGLATAQSEDESLAGDTAFPSSTSAQPQIYRLPGAVVTPATSVMRAEDAGITAHTNHLIFIPAGHAKVFAVPDSSTGETPASLGCVYKLGPSFAGCNPQNGGNAYATGGWGAIALVDAYDNPNAASDLAYFSSQFGLPAANFKKVYANSSFGTLNGMTASCSGVPAGNADWGTEIDLDIQWAHAMAPSAQIILVEACTASLADLFYAEQVAGIEVTAAGGGDVSNSWGGGEFSGEVGAIDVFFRYHWKYITYFASAGDSGWGAQYPSSSPWVVSAGGTTINRDVNGNFLSENCWSGSGGGVSQYETWQNPPNINNGMGPWTAFQYPLFGQTARQTPDMSFDADPASGVWVYDSYGSQAGWLIVGGTSLSSPALAGIVNSAGNRRGEAPEIGGAFTNEENNLIYSQEFSHANYAVNFYDVKTGSNGSGHNAKSYYDQCTGVGTPRGKAGK